MQVTTADGGTMDAHLVVPESGSGPGLVLLMEIFGVGAYIKTAAERLAALGYTVLAPDLYWRVERGIALDHDEAGLHKAFGYVQKLDVPQAVADALDALAHLRAMPATGGRAGVLGFCLGGTLAYLVAANGDPDTAVCYYGSGIHDALEYAGSVTCPVLFHYGTRDDYIPTEKSELVRATFEDRPDCEVRFHDAGHAFDNSEAAMFHDPAAAAEAWEQTAAFLARTLPVSRA